MALLRPSALLSLLVLALPGSGAGQLAPPQETPRPRLSLLAGSVGSRSLLGGWHAGVAMNQSLSDRVDLRVQGIVASGDIRGLSALGGLEVDLAHGVYATAGAGAYFDDGTPMATSLGVGSTLDLFSSPLDVELRYVSTEGGGLYWGIRTPLIR